MSIDTPMITVPTTIERIAFILPKNAVIGELEGRR